MLTTVTARAVRPHGLTTPLPESGVVELTPAMHTTTGGAFQSRETVCVTLVDGEISTPITPGIWAVRVRPAHGPAWSGFQVEVPAQSEPFDLATAAPVAVIDGVAMTRGEPGRGIDFIGNADAEGWATVTWTDGTVTQMRVPTVTLTAEERAVLDGVLAQAREAEQDARRAETAAGTAMGHASAAADARDAARAAAGDAAAVLQETRAALAAGEMTGEDGHSPVVDMTGDQVTVDGEIVGPHLTGPAPSVEWTGTRLTVGGQTGPDLKGAPGAPGKDSTVPGPPNVLSIGTVTTGTPGSQAVAQIKGTAPSQSLDLTIPTGKDATSPAFTASATALAATAQPTASISGAYPNLALALGIPAGGGGGSTITAAGRPDVASTMDPDTQARVAGATSGILFSSTDRPQGAALWQKQGTAWVCVAGDTGWYQYLAPYVTSGGIWLKRTQAGCLATLGGGLYGTASLGGLTVGGITRGGVVPVPSGWRTPAAAIIGVTDDGGPWIGNLYITGTSDASVIQVRGATVASVASGRAEIGLYIPSDPWPVSITGTKMA